MTSLPNLLKFYSKKSNKVEKYNFNEYFEEAKKVAPKEEEIQETPADALDIPPEDAEPIEEAEQVKPAAPQEEQKSESISRVYAEEIIQQAQEEADRILEEAKAAVAAQKEKAAEEGYQSGFDKGYQEGYAKGTEEADAFFQTESRAFLEEMRGIVTEVSNQKEEILEKYKQDLKNIAIAIGEKVIQVSLKSSGNVIEKMILSATEKLHTRDWAKIYISKADADLLVRGDRDILRVIGRLSENLKVIVMENEKPGACIIELPDEIIDASASTQVENIKEILKNTGI